MWNVLCVQTSRNFFIFSSSFLITCMVHTTNITFIKMYAKFHTVYYKCRNKMSNICSSTITVQILHVLLSSRNYKSVYLLRTNFKAATQNHIPFIITESILFLYFLRWQATLLNSEWYSKHTLHVSIVCMCIYIYIYIYICTYIYEHSVLILHYILTRKLRIKMIIEPNVSLRMNDLTRLLKIWFDQLMVLHLLSWLTLKLTEHLLSYYWR